jgi:hypothetical protein
MKESLALLTTLALVSCLLLAGCSQREKAWEEARAANTPESYDRFLATYPEGEFVSQAKARAAELRETRDWEKATATNTLDAYREFVKSHPDGRMSDEARIRIESFALSAPMPESAPGLATLEGPATPAASASAGGYRIQLGAFSGGEKQAMNEWRRLQTDFPALLQGLTPSVKLATTSSGHLYRLQAGFTEETRARSICAKLQAEGRACVVVLP